MSIYTEEAERRFKCNCAARLHCESPRKHPACEVCPDCLSGNPATCNGLKAERRGKRNVVVAECWTCGTIQRVPHGLPLYHPASVETCKELGHDVRPVNKPAGKE